MPYYPPGSGVTVHSNLTGLSADDHLQYVFSAGRAGGQTIVGGTAASENLTLQSTSNATRGYVQVTDSLFVDTTGGTYSPDAPRTIGFNNFASGRAGRFQFGDVNTALQNGFDQLMQLYAYWQIQIYGRRTGTAVPWTSYGSAASTASVQVINSDVNAAALEVKGAASQAANLQQWINSAGTTLSSVDASGNISAPGYNLATMVLGSLPFGACNASINVYGTTSTFYVLVIPSTNISVKTVQVYAYQGAVGTVQVGLYGTNGTRVAVTDTPSSNTTGFITTTFATAQALTKGTAYFFGVACTGNGSTFAGRSDGNASWNVNPKPYAYENNNRLPATATFNATASIVWIGAFTA
jgi:hypothetical protein